MPSRPDLVDVEAALADIAAGEPAIAAAYVFGSIVRGTAGPLSDIDVGLLLAEGDGDPVLGRVADALARRLRTSALDVHSLATLPPHVRYHALREGRRVVARDLARLERFITDTVLQYLDFEPVRARAFAVQRAAILERR